MNLKVKRTTAGILAAALMLSIGTNAFAAKQAPGRNYVDNNGDGICDYYVPGQCKGNGSGCGFRGGQGNGCRGGRYR